MTTRTIGLDLAKSVFQAHGVPHTGDQAGFFRAVPLGFRIAHKASYWRDLVVVVSNETALRFFRLPCPARFISPAADCGFCMASSSFSAMR